MGGSFIFLSGPSGVGKGPLMKAVKREITKQKLNINLKGITLYSCRAMRAGEKEGDPYHFMTREQIESFKNQDNFIVFPVRKDLQAIDLNDIKKITSEPDAVGFLETFHTAVNELSGSSYLKGVDIRTVFMSPLSSDDIYSMKFPKEVEKAFYDLIREKVINRFYRKNGALSLVSLRDAETRASTAFKEMCSACGYHYIIVNHDGEDSPNWGVNRAFGDAGRAVKSMLQILQGVEKPDYVVQWRHELFR